MKKKNNDWSGLLNRRVFTSCKNSVAGLASCFKHEEAFRIEVILAAALIPASYWLAETLLENLLLITAVIVVLITELLNSAVEATVDRVGLDYHDLAKRAKDIGSAAVFLALLLFAIVWGAIILKTLR